MEERSSLRHTSIGNGLAFLFDKGRGTLAVLQGTASEHEYPRLREAIVRWRRTTRPAVLRNLEAFEREYTPFAEGLAILQANMPAEAWKRLVVLHGRRVRALLGIRVFAVGVREAVERFDNGLKAVTEGTMTLDELRRLHSEVLDAYRAP